MAFAAQLKLESRPDWIFQYQFDSNRKWTFDFANRHLKLAVEIDGTAHRGIQLYTSERERENEKTNCATNQGWRILRGTTEQAENGWLYQCLKPWL